MSKIEKKPELQFQKYTLENPQKKEPQPNNKHKAKTQSPEIHSALLSKKLIQEQSLNRSQNPTDADYVAFQKPIPKEFQPIDASSLKPPPTRDLLPTPNTTVHFFDQKGDKKTGIVQGFDYKGRPVVDVEGSRHIITNQELQKALSSQPQVFSLNNIQSGRIYKPNQPFIDHMNAALGKKIVGNQSAQDYLDRLRENGSESYVVGGAVRDLVHATATQPKISSQQAQKMLNDIDITTMAHPNEAKKIYQAFHGNDSDTKATYFPEYGRAHFKNSDQEEGLDYNTTIDGSTVYLPKEINPDTPNDNVVPATFDHDLLKDTHSRDFAVNSLYYDPYNQVIIDPTGLGMSDAINKHLRFAGAKAPQNLTTLYDDPEMPRRFFKFRMRGYTSNLYTTRLMLEQANKKYQAWVQNKENVKFYHEVYRILPKQDEHTQEGISKGLDQLVSIIDKDEKTTHTTTQLIPLIEQHKKQITHYILTR
jgi:hypothetical protein